MTADEIKRMVGKTIFRSSGQLASTTTTPETPGGLIVLGVTHEGDLVEIDTRVAEAIS